MNKRIIILAVLCLCLSAIAGAGYAFRCDLGFEDCSEEGTPATPTGTPATPTGTPATPTGTPATPTGTPATPAGTPATPAPAGPGSIVGATMGDIDVWSNWDGSSGSQFFIGGKARCDCLAHGATCSEGTTASKVAPNEKCMWKLFSQEKQRCRSDDGCTRKIIFDLGKKVPVTDFSFNILSHGNIGETDLKADIIIGNKTIRTGELRVRTTVNSDSDRTAVIKASDYTDDSINETVDKVEVLLRVISNVRDFRLQLGNAKVY